MDGKSHQRAEHNQAKVYTKKNGLSVNVELKIENTDDSDTDIDAATVKEERDDDKHAVSNDYSSNANLSYYETERKLQNTGGTTFPATNLDYNEHIVQNRHQSQTDVNTRHKPELPGDQTASPDYDSDIYAALPGDCEARDCNRRPESPGTGGTDQNTPCAENGEDDYSSTKYKIEVKIERTSLTVTSEDDVELKNELVSDEPAPADPINAVQLNGSLTAKEEIFDEWNSPSDGGNPDSKNDKLLEKELNEPIARTEGTGVADHSKDTCSFCGYKSAKRHSLIVHMRTHTGEKPYCCKICDYRGKTSSALTCHMRVHTGEKTFRCDLCDYRSAHSNGLAVHVRTHTGEKPYSCLYCKHKCRTSSALKAHVRTHDGDKTISCELCPYKCTNTASLTRHMRTHSGTRPYSCHHCQYRCAEKGALRSHMNIHSDVKAFSCDNCHRKFAQKYSLVKHMRTHTGEKPYSCKYCPYRSARNAQVVTHTRTHTGEKPFGCKFCEYRTGDKKALGSHMRTHNRDLFLKLTKWTKLIHYQEPLS